MPPQLLSESTPKSGYSQTSSSKTPAPQQRTLHTFFSRSVNNFPPSVSSVPRNKASLAQPAQTSSFAVVLQSSPNKHSRTTVARTVEDDADDLAMADRSPQFRRLAAQATSGVSLAKPALPVAVAAMDDEATSPGTTPQPQMKKRGRPKGFRPIKTAEKTLRHEAPTTGPRRLRPDRPEAGSMYAGKPKRRGRPPKAQSPPPRAIYESLTPHFNVFICEWSGCQAELHNFATLQKHVAVAHTKNPPFCCQWAKCAERQPPQMFSTLADLATHVEDIHMPPIAWQVGDGPQVSFKKYGPVNGIELPDYLFDKEGLQITPSIHQQQEEDFLTWRKNRRRLKDLLLQRDENIPSEDESNGVLDATG